MVWMMAFWTILSSLSLPPRPDETLVLEFLLELSPSSKSTLILRCLSRVLNTSSTVGPAVTHTHTQPAERTHHCKGKTDSGPKGFQPGESVKNWEELTSVKLNKSTFLNVFASSKLSTQLKLMLKLWDFHLFFTKILHWWRFYMFHSILTENNGH